MIEKWLRSRFGNVQMASQGKEMRVNCPFCRARTGREDVKFHLYINTHKPVCHCFRCSWQGNYIGLVMSVDGCTYFRALQEIDSPTYNVSEFDKPHSPRGLVQGDKVACKPNGFLPLGGVDLIAYDLSMEERAVRQYLRRREVSSQLVREHFGWIPGTNRVWMLVDDAWWQGRLIVAGEPKYISPPWPKGDSLWNATALNGNVVDVCEGVFSAIAVGPTAVALCAKTINNEQLRRIIRSNVSTVRLRLDADAISDAHSMADRFVEYGYTGELKIQYMMEGDPADGVESYKVTWGWDTKIVQSLVGI